MTTRFPSTLSLTRCLAGAALVCAGVGAMLGGPTALAAHRSSAPAAAPQWLKWNAESHTASLTLIAAYNNALQGFNFNGYGHGKMVVTVPLGAHVTVTFKNQAAAVTHSFVITPYASRNAAGTYPLAFKGASSSNPTVGTAKGPTEHVSFVASKAGKYAIVCAVPGHEPAGMWDVFQVRKGSSATITVR